ncbi:MAG: hypothetical protein D8M59_13160 [Planctomycetes bacterium]|nr:hypothetical protein [Planctomycetota bacterium]NOG54951.1 hypothetical protein [Planctomycetota bacterium]
MTVADRPDKHNRTFLSVIRWPDTMDVQQMTARLCDATGRDESIVSRRVRITPPAIIGVLEEDAARSAANVIIELGGSAFSPTIADIEALGPTMKIKDIHLGAEGIVFELWRGEERECSIDPDQIDVMVRTRLSEAHLASPGDSAVGLVLDPGGSGEVSAGWGFGGSYGLASAMHAYSDMESGEHSGQLKLPCKLDIHVKDGRVFQIDAEKFGFQVLGGLKGMRENQKIDKICEWFTSLTQRTILDPFFGYWRPPAGIDRIRIPLMRVNNDDPGFVFYSRWVALLYRHVLSGS